ncbi:hypothetical protein SKB0087_06550 [Anaerococcus nagyae]
MLNDELLDEEMMIEVLQICFEDGIGVLDEIDLETAFNQILWFFTMGEYKDKPEVEPKDDDKVVSKKSKIIYSYTYDWHYIYSAFLQCYNIDLFKDNMHWWQFKALFNSLSEDTQFAKIMSYRSMTISSKMSKEEKKHYQQMKKIYALPDIRSEEEKELSFARSMFKSMKD